jgi:hypothetical protein
MLPYQDNLLPENPKVRRAGFFLKLNSLQNHGYDDTILSFNPWFCSTCKTMLPLVCIQKYILVF